MPNGLVTAVTSVVLIVGGGSGIAALLLVRKQMRVLGSTSKRENADAESTLSTAALALIAPYQARVAEAEEKAQTAAEDARRANARADRSERRIARLEQLGGLHMIWDQEAQAEVQRLGGHLRLPPQLDDVKA